MTELERVIQSTPLANTHDHLGREEVYLANPPDILQELFNHYTSQDLISAGAAAEDLAFLLDSSNPDIAARFERIRPFWEAAYHTGYSEATRIAARETFELEELTGGALAEANAKYSGRDRHGERLRLLRDEAGLDHVQVDDQYWATQPDPSGPDFFFSDITWMEFAVGQVNAEAIENRTGVTVRDLGTLRMAMRKIFEIRTPLSLAVKMQHAYMRTIDWTERTDAEAAPLLQKVLRGVELTYPEMLCLGDWSIARGVELAGEFNLPFKIHTGFLAGNNSMEIDRVRPGQLCRLFLKYPQTRFDLFHTGYGYQLEIIALAKQFSNVALDMCWAWGIDPFSSCDFLRRVIHSVPANKLFAFGGDSFYASITAAYSRQARRWIARALGAEVAEGMLSEREAIALARRIMNENQEQFFRVSELKARMTEMAELTA
jgi:uncharacterized protein